MIAALMSAQTVWPSAWPQQASVALPTGRKWLSDVLDIVETVASETTDSPETEADTLSDGFAANAVQNMWDIFWQPEVEHRGGLSVTGPIAAAMAIMKPGAPVEIRLNDEVEVRARARADSPVASGELLTAENLDALENFEPRNVHPDAGWALLVVLPNGSAYLQFDFRRNRSQGNRRLALAAEYLQVARLAQNGRMWGPTLDAAHTAAELGITPMMFLSDDEAVTSKRNRHGRRLHWLNT